MIPVIISGGVGSRLWPVSREQHPKPFIRLGDGQSLLQKAFLRAAQLKDARSVMTVTNRDLFFKTKDDYHEVAPSHMHFSYVLEPFGRNTAAAIAAAALEVERMHGPNEVMLVLAADHLITDQIGFEVAVDQAVTLAKNGQLVTFGIEPSAPETGYGYIEVDGYRVRRFVEKPNAAKAQEYLDSGSYLWNAGMFCFTAGTLIEQMQQHCPKIIAATRQCLDASRRTEDTYITQIELHAENFMLVPEDSIDYAVMEKSQSIAVVPCRIGWSDIGSWTALGDLTDSDDQGNRVMGQAMLHDTRNCTIQSSNRLVGTVGLDNLLIIDTPDALLVAHRNKAQDVKHLFATLKNLGHETHKTHKTVHRPWGTYTVLEEGQGFKIKRIEVNPGGRLSLQMHHHRSEHWIVVSGTAQVVNGERDITIHTNQSTYIPAGHKHRLENQQKQTLVMIEVQSGEYLGEDDIVRFEDQYGRAA
ncbi:mannose-1-phosphate guanylyltransferase/mannose-6-phosphate isomerase [Limnohabitans sp. 2KL-1]|uniref:mannose-1-phosphate guanylyltransferase/mannose-6-phosphate isomerase n=1 Tax=Limnohabitans sp. 2KL-1 TaxID=1100699 RepID=UPI000D367856|nr:mannose-1-phosphate guanylyltransferase/mannose-6-phosphate isomerase [Limnohabitans sp. 2KL-1]PUE50653.1 mannose-1-phosphate guanylyltransferase/mannose-6-phosphate isomerase [Limnohabitans sp. 2KL-1]